MICLPLLALMNQGPLPDFATLPHARKYGCVRVEVAPAIDGDLDHPVWKSAPWSENFMDIEGPQHVPQPRLRTRVKMLWDQKNLYVGAELEEPQIWATLTDRDSVIFHDNDFEIFLDPDDDNHQYVEFEMNALNTVWDLLLPKPYRDGGPAINLFDMRHLRSAVKIDGKLNDPAATSEKWTLTVAIPWQDISAVSTRRVPPAIGDRWRINFSRVEWDLGVERGKFEKVTGRPEHNWVWSPQWVVNMHWPEMWGFLEFQGASSKPVSDDPNWRTRMELMNIYHQQKAFFEQHQRWAKSLKELGSSSKAYYLAWEGVWLASLPGAKGETLTVREDSRLTVTN